MATPRPVQPRTPAIVIIAGVFAALYLLLPVLALATRVPWADLGAILSESDVQELLRLTLAAAALSTLITIAVGVPLAVWMQSMRRGSGFARLLVLLPLAMPPVVSGLALSAAIGNNGLLAPVLDALGWQLAFAFAGVVAAHVFISLPFVVVTVDAALRQQDREVTASAAGIGMSPGRILRSITLPTIAPAVATGAGLAFARSLGEFGTTITFAGSMPGKTRTVSLAVYLEREVDRDGAYALSAVLIILAILVLALAALPGLLRREPHPRPRTIAPLDPARLRRLTAPESGAEVNVEVDGVSTTFPRDRITAVVGPNGSGKSTLVGMIAGRLTGARVTVGGQRVDKLPAHRRGVVLLTQKPGLPRVAKVSGAVTMATRDPARTRELLDAAGLSSLHDVPVAALSGGQAAQVALVRALAARPRVLILDEPLAAIDVSSAARWRQLLRAAAADRTTLLVTHDPLDVAGLSDQLVALEAGRVSAAGDTGELLRVPPSDFVARISGLNRLTGVISEVKTDSVTVSNDNLTITGTLPEGVCASVGDDAVVTIAPEATVLRLPAATDPTESARNVWPGTVTALQAADVTTTRVAVDVVGGGLTVPVTSSSALSMELEPGTKVQCVTKALTVRVHPRPTS